jgi:hypothetical protein
MLALGFWQLVLKFVVSANGQGLIPVAIPIVIGTNNQFPNYFISTSTSTPVFIGGVPSVINFSSFSGNTGGTVSVGAY